MKIKKWTILRLYFDAFKAMLHVLWIGMRTGTFKTAWKLVTQLWTIHFKLHRMLDRPIEYMQPPSFDTVRQMARTWGLKPLENESAEELRIRIIETILNRPVPGTTQE